MAFNLDRADAARRLGVSTRTIDRYIQAGRIQTRRIGKKTYLEESDVENLRQEDPSRREEDYIVIMNEEEEKKQQYETPSHISSEKWLNLYNDQGNKAIAEFSRIYTEAQAIITKKDAVIQDLAYKLGKVETELSKSVDATLYERAKTLIENNESKNQSEVEEGRRRISFLEKQLKNKNSFIVGLIILFVIVLVGSIAMMFYNRLI